MDKKEKISVIIPTYNREKTIDSSIKSVLNQTYNNIEVIVVDDNSNDSTEKIIKDINDARVIYIKLRKNHGAGYARNIGIKKSSGKYIAFQDSDDVFEKNKLEIQYKNLVKNNSDLDFCKLKVNDDGNVWIFPNDEQDKNLEKSNLATELCNGNLISTQSILAKREVLEDICFDVILPRFQDYDLVLRIAQKYKISYTKKALVNIYRQVDSLSNSNDKLVKACLIMLKKDYRLNNNQKLLLNNTLVYWLSKPQIDKVYKEFSEFKTKYDLLNTDYQKIKSDYNILTDRYNKIINSKRVRILSKILKFFGK